MQVTAIRCDQCDKICSSDSSDIFHFSGEVTDGMGNVVLLKATDVCRTCLVKVFAPVHNLDEPLKRNIGLGEFIPSHIPPNPIQRTEVRPMEVICKRTPN